METSQHCDLAQFGVRGEFKFTLPQKFGLHPHIFRRGIMDVDKKFPWESYPENPWSGRSILDMSPISEEKHGEDITYTFTIRPYAGIGPRRIYAYHRYLCNLAHQVTLGMQDVFYGVSVKILLDADTTEYLTPLGRARADAAKAKTIGEILSAM